MARIPAARLGHMVGAAKLGVTKVTKVCQFGKQRMACGHRTETEEIG